MNKEPGREATADHFIEDRGDIWYNKNEFVQPALEMMDGEDKFETTDRQRKPFEGKANKPSWMALQEREFRQ